MTHRPRTKTHRPSATVYGERVLELLPEMAALCVDGRLLPAGVDSDSAQDMLLLSLTLPTSRGGSVRRALLRSLADLLRREADSGGDCVPAACLPCREAAAMRVLVQRLQLAARSLGITDGTLAERAVLLGEVTAATPCLCLRVGR